MKEAYYFSHDSNSRNDGKILNMRMKHGMRGYGIFWSIVEMLRDESGYKMRLQCERIAFELHEDSELIESVINDFDLFVVKDGFFWSESLLRRMKMKEKKSDKARESALKRWNKDNESERNANALETQSESNASKVKEKKVNEIKDKEKIVAVKDEEEKHNDIFRKLWENIHWLEQTCMKYKTDIKCTRNHLDEFRKLLLLKADFKQSEKDARTHFINWIDKGNPIPKPKKRITFDGF